MGALFRKLDLGNREVLGQVRHVNEQMLAFRQAHLRSPLDHHGTEHGSLPAIEAVAEPTVAIDPIVDSIQMATPTVTNSNACESPAAPIALAAAAKVGFAEDPGEPLASSPPDTHEALLEVVDQLKAELELLRSRPAAPAPEAEAATGSALKAILEETAEAARADRAAAQADRKAAVAERQAAMDCLDSAKKQMEALALRDAARTEVVHAQTSLSRMSSPKARTCYDWGRQ